MRCLDCSHENPAQSRFCAQCGARLGATCAGCGAALAEGQRFCAACGRPLGTAERQARAPATGEGERRYATVVFSDLSGFTMLNERLDAEEVEELMGRIKRTATAVIERHGGIVNQFVGDEVYSVFGVPQARRDDPQRAVRAALELHRAVAEITGELSAKVGRPLVMHTGINTGPVLVRESESHAGRYVLTGDTVNTAARLLKVAEEGEVVVSPETCKQVSEVFHVRPGEPVALKGKEAPLVPYRVLGEGEPAEFGGRALVGRAEEMRQLAALAQSCLELGRGRVIVLRGDPGIGKTRLAAALVEHARNLGFACHRALVLDFGAETGRDAVRSLVQSMLAIGADADAPQRHAAVGRALADGLIEADRAVLLYDLVDVEPPPEARAVRAAMSADARRRGTLEALGMLVRKASVRKPLVLLVEDVHWADRNTLDQLAVIAAAAASHPLLLVLSTRFDGDPTAGQWRGVLRGVPVSAIDLGPLAPEDAQALVAGLSQMPEAVVRSCVERAEGNPLFLEQLILNAGEAALDKLPGTIQALVLSRLDRLEPVHKLALQAAAILGQRFALEALRHVLEDPGYGCEVLEEHFLVRPEGSQYLFCHALIRDGARESMLKARRKELHARAAAWFADRDLVLAAEHFERADSPQAAAAYLAASRTEAAQFRYEAALSLAERGLAVATERADRFSLLLARARLLLELGRAQDSIEAGRAALEAASGAAERAAALINQAEGMRIRDRIDDGLAALGEAQPLAEQAADPALLSQLHHLRGNFYFPLGRIDECLREHRAALAFAKEAKSLETEAIALGGLGDAHYLGGRMRSSNEQFRKCVDLSRKLGLGRLEVTVLHMIGWTAAYLNDMRSAVEHGAQAAELAAKVSHPRSEVLARLLVGYTDGYIRGNYEPAARELEKALALAQALGAKRFEAQAHQMLAMIACRRSDREVAMTHAASAMRICQEHGMGFTGAWLHGVMAGFAREPVERDKLLADGERLLASGCVSHNHFHFYANAIDATLAAAQWDAASRYCAKLEAYAATEPLPWTEFTIARGEALVSHGRGDRSAELADLLGRLRAQAAQAEINNALPALDTAIASFA